MKSKLYANYWKMPIYNLVSQYYYHNILLYLVENFLMKNLFIECCYSQSTIILISIIQLLKYYNTLDFQCYYFQDF